MLLSNCTMSGGRVTHTYKQPFATVALMTAQATKGKLALVAGRAISEDWGALLVEFRTALRSIPWRDEVVKFAAACA